MREKEKVMTVLMSISCVLGAVVMGYLIGCLEDWLSEKETRVCLRR